MKLISISILFFLIALPARALVPNDKFIEQQWYLSRIGAFDAWDISTGSREVVVAVLDTGIDLNHPDIADNIWTNKKEISGDGIDNDNNGYVDDVHGYDFVNDTGDGGVVFDSPLDEDAIPHATIIAGIIAGVGDNSIGVAGVNWKASMMSVRILDNEGSGNSGTATKGVYYAIKNKADVINLSFVGFDDDPLFKKAVETAHRAGIVVVAAVGNNDEGGIDVDATPIYPACYGENADKDWILGVSATNINNSRATFSNYGSVCTDISAPGENIFSATLQDDNEQLFSQGFYQGGWSGTSMATPMVSGAVALLKAKYPLIKPDTVKKILRLSAAPVESDGQSAGKMGAGLLNIARAFELAPLFVSDIERASVAIPETAPNSLVKLSCSSNAELNDPCKAVYFFSESGTRHAFPNEKVFFSWYEDFDDVTEISKSSMSSLSLGRNVTYKPGVKLVKFQTVRTVYAVSTGGVLRAISTEQVAEDLYDADWREKVDDIADVFFSNYSFGDKIETAGDFDSLTERTMSTHP